MLLCITYLCDLCDEREGAWHMVVFLKEFYFLSNWDTYWSDGFEALYSGSHNKHTHVHNNIQPRGIKKFLMYLKRNLIHNHFTFITKYI